MSKLTNLYLFFSLPKSIARSRIPKGESLKGISDYIKRGGGAHEPPVKTCQVPRGENIPSQYMGYLHALLIILIASGGGNLDGASCLSAHAV